ncbi:MAG: hypothetical protein IMZ49_00450 [Actinobacteria bacterium]|nr:hypothetical protein [Actinomycetota bacterium]MBE3126975.1 hypothetical protein [Candidatus Atribacteria bacterium]
MEIDFALASLVGGITGLIGLMLLDRNWYRRENFKVGRDLTKSKNQLEIQKMRRDLGLDKKSNPIVSPNVPPSGGIDMLRSLAPLLQSLAPEQIQDLIEGVTGMATPESVEGGIGGLDGIDGLIEFATKNPEIVKSFLGGVKGGAQKQDEYPSQV